jgi:hypothetical protein
MLTPENNFYRTCDWKRGIVRRRFDKGIDGEMLDEFNADKMFLFINLIMDFDMAMRHLNWTDNWAVSLNKELTQFRQEKSYRRNLIIKNDELCFFIAKQEWEQKNLHQEATEERKINTHYCECCSTQCRSKAEYENHIQTMKHKRLAGIVVVPETYCCQACEYSTRIKCHYDRHLKSKTHSQKNIS